MGEKSKATRSLDQELSYNKTLALPLYRAFFEDNEDLELGLSAAGIVVLIQPTGTKKPWCLDRSEPVLIVPIGDSLIRGLKIYPDQLQGLNHWMQCLMLTLKMDGPNLSRLALDLGTTEAVAKLLEELSHTHLTDISNDKPGRLISKWVRSREESEKCVGSSCAGQAGETRAPPADTDTPGKPVYTEDKRLMRFLITAANDRRERDRRVGYHVAYCNFVTRNSGLKKAALREKITHTLNWPKFLMEHFSASPCSEFPERSHKLLSALVMQAVSSRKCAWEDCNEFSLLKCKACKISYYCNKDCQSLDANRHQVICMAGNATQTTATQGSSTQLRGDYHTRSLGIQMRRGLADLGCIPRRTLTLKEFEHIVGLRTLERGIKYFASRGILRNIATQAGFKFQLTALQLKRLIANCSRSLTADKFERQLLSAGYVVARVVDEQALQSSRRMKRGSALRRLSNESEFICKPKLLEVLSTVSETLQRKESSSTVVFKFKDILTLLKRYLLKNTHRLKVDNTKMIIEGDPLGEALGVPVLHSNQIPKYLLAQLIPYTPGN